MSIVQIQGLTKRYGRRVGVEEVDLRVEEGEVFGFLGPNGAGKTTTIRVLLGFLRASDGSARVFGEDCWGRSHVIKREVGYVPGDLRLYPWMTGRNGLGIVGRVRGRDVAKRGLELGELFGLEMDVRVRSMSRGMRQKLGLILALAHDPKLVILDEPTSGLDPIMQERLGQLLREMADSGRTVFFSSHTLSEVERLCDRVAIVRGGKIVADETIEALRRRANRVVTLWFKNTRESELVELPPFLRLERCDKARVRCELRGTTAELVAWLGTHPVADMEVSPPDLEQLFQSYYKSENGNGKAKP